MRSPRPKGRDGWRYAGPGRKRYYYRHKAWHDAFWPVVIGCLIIGAALRAWA